MTHDGNSPTLFDPFNDRKAHDIRNRLSQAFVSELIHGDDTQVEAAAAPWLTDPALDAYHPHIRSRLDAYKLAREVIVNGNLRDPRLQALVLWNRGLFFELHELLETVWRKADGPEKTGLKGLIQAAGAYVHALRGKPDAASGLARRAQINIRSGAAALGFIGNLESLTAALSDISSQPPVLVPAKDNDAEESGS